MQNIQKAMNDSSWTAAIEQKNNFSSLPLAVVLDIDETVLDTSRYQAQLVIEGKEFSSESWERWLALKQAPSIPGAVTFINTMHDLEIEVFYITNRECKSREGDGSACPQEQDTMDNLNDVGIIHVKPENIYLKNEQPGWTSEKKTRREAVVSKYRVLMLFGDDLGDFLPDVKKNITPVQRTELVRKYEDNWGKKWYILSNPMYGSWLQVLDEPKSKYLEGY
jgi:acid phosphatase